MLQQARKRKCLPAGIFINLYQHIISRAKMNCARFPCRFSHIIFYIYKNKILLIDKCTYMYILRKKRHKLKRRKLKYEWNGMRVRRTRRNLVTIHTLPCPRVFLKNKNHKISHGCSDWISLSHINYIYI